MRFVSIIVMLASIWVSTHEGIHHAGFEASVSTLFSHVGDRHDHDKFNVFQHEHADDMDNEHESDHHDARSHDHPKIVVLVKKQTQSVPSAALTVIAIKACASCGDDGAMLWLHAANYGLPLSLTPPPYLSTQRLRL